MIVWNTVAGSFQTQHFAHYQNSVRDIVTEKKKFETMQTIGTSIFVIAFKQFTNTLHEYCDGHECK